MKIIWTSEAKYSFNANIDYILQEWGEEVALKFVDRVDNVILNISRNPKIYPLIKEDEQLYRCCKTNQPLLPTAII